MTYCCIGFTYHLLSLQNFDKNNYDSYLMKAIDYYHQSLALKPQDSFASEMLTIALEEY